MYLQHITVYGGGCEGGLLVFGQQITDGSSLLSRVFKYGTDIMEVSGEGVVDFPLPSPCPSSPHTLTGFLLRERSFLR